MILVLITRWFYILNYTKWRALTGTTESRHIISGFAHAWLAGWQLIWCLPPFGKCCLCFRKMVDTRSLFQMYQPPKFYFRERKSKITIEHLFFGSFSFLWFKKLDKVQMKIFLTVFLISFWNFWQKKSELSCFVSGGNTHWLPKC